MDAVLKKDVDNGHACQLLGQLQQENGDADLAVATFRRGSASRGANITSESSNFMHHMQRQL